jgi:hypothetical protein
MTNIKKLIILLSKYGVKKFDDNDFIFKQIKLIGYDADIFLQEFIEIFEVDMTEFVFKDFFQKEIPIPFAYLFISKPKYDITFYELLNIVKNKKWKYNKNIL